MVELISVVIPCYNEEPTVEEFHRRASALAKSMNTYRFEFLYVNDGSTDRTGAILNALAEKNDDVKVLHLAQNRGHQIALTAGIDYARGDVVVTIDADLQHPPEFIRNLVKKIEEGYDIVHAQRLQRKGDKWLKRVTAKWFYFFMRYFSDIQLTENCGDFRAFTSSVHEAVKGFRMPHRFMRGIFVQLGFRQCAIEFESDERFAGTSKYSFIKMMNLAVDGALGFSAAPIRFITWISILLWCISLVHLGKALFEHFILKTTVMGWTSIIVLMFFFTGLILFSIAIIGSYVGRIYVQGQGIPLYWLSAVRNIDLDGIQEHAEKLVEVKLSQRILKSRPKNFS
jgi:glycosyltransferase involved in cell wall biosynthesis